MSGWSARAGFAIALLTVGASPPVLGSDVFNGKKIYQAHCRGCHGASGRGDMPGTPNISRGVGLLNSDVVLWEAIADGKRAMPGYRGVLSEQDILDVISYLRTLN